MILVTGGRYNGKKDWVKENLGYNESDFSCNISDDKKVFFDLENYQNETDENIKNLLLSKEVVICSEIGSGIIPIEKSDRIRQENIGRLCIFLAKNATAVYRVFNGIGMKIK